MSNFSESNTKKKKIFDKRFTILLIFQLIIVSILILFFLFFKNKNSNGDFSFYRKVANKLQAAGLITESVKEYETYFKNADIQDVDKATIAFSIASLYEQANKLSEAIKWYYFVEILDPDSNHRDEAKRKIVAILEKLGKHAAAKRTLQDSTLLNSKEKNKKSDSVILAKIGEKKIYQYELDKLLDSLPVDMRKKMSSKEEKLNLLKKIIADEILAQKALRLEYDKKDQFREKINDIRKQLLVNMLLQNEFNQKVKIDKEDLKNYYLANQDKYNQKEKSKKYNFEQVKEMVEMDYQQFKAQNLYQKLIEESISGDEVEIFAEKL